jgi:type III pantothenate kinase
MLAIDIGNTFIKVAVFKGNDITDVFSVPTERCLSENAFLKHLPEHVLKSENSVVISSVRKKVLEIISREIVSRTACEPFVCDIGTDTGITNKYLTPETLGIDRLITAAAAFRLYSRKGRPVIVVDMGTATTVDIVSAEGSFIGGVITAGLNSSLKGLLAEAPELPDVNIEKMERLVGRTTLECMSSGAIAGHAAKITGLCSMMAKDAVVVVTGGLVKVLSNWFKEDYIIDEHLLFKGLKLIYEYNACRVSNVP